MNVVTKDNLEKMIEEMAVRLLHMAKDRVWNKISADCLFILSEIKDGHENFDEERRSRKTENDRKKPLPLKALILRLQEIYDSLYDVNLHIYKSTATVTIIDIRYYPKSSLEEAYRANVMQNQPMLHAKVALPPWLAERKEKFNVNREHNVFLTKWNLFWWRQRFRLFKR